MDQTKPNLGRTQSDHSCFRYVALSWNKGNTKAIQVENSNFALFDHLGESWRKYLSQFLVQYLWHTYWYNFDGTLLGRLGNLEVCWQKKLNSITKSSTNVNSLMICSTQTVSELWTSFTLCAIASSMTSLMLTWCSLKWSHNCRTTVVLPQAGGPAISNLIGCMQ